MLPTQYKHEATETSKDFSLAGFRYLSFDFGYHRPCLVNENLNVFSVTNRTKALVRSLARKVGSFGLVDVCS